MRHLPDVVVVDGERLGLDVGEGELGCSEGPGVLGEEHELLRSGGRPVEEFVAFVDRGVVEEEDAFVRVVGVAGSEHLEQMEKEENGPGSVVLLAVHGVEASAVAADAEGEVDPAPKMLARHHAGIPFPEPAFSAGVNGHDGTLVHVEHFDPVFEDIQESEGALLPDDAVLLDVGQMAPDVGLPVAHHLFLMQFPPDQRH